MRRWLQDHGARDAIVVPLPVSERFRRHRDRRNRLGETATFTQDDVVLLQTLTGHLAVAGGSARLVERLAVEASHDALTGLANRTPAGRNIEQLDGDAGCSALRAAARPRPVQGGQRRLGHTGDRLLRVVAERLRACLPADATVARLGGDEFAVLLPGVDATRPRPRAIGARLIARLEQPVTL